MDMKEKGSTAMEKISEEQEKALQELGEYAKDNIGIVTRLVSLQAHMLGIDDQEAVSSAMAQAVETQFAPSSEETEEQAREDEETDAKLDRAFGVSSPKSSMDEKLDRAFGLSSDSLSDKESKRLSKSARNMADRAKTSSFLGLKKHMDKQDGLAK